MTYHELIAQGATGEPYSLFYHVWPWMGLGAAIVMIILIFCTNQLRSDKLIPRFKDPVSLAWIGFVVYLLHNFEEFGQDLYGNQLGFTYFMNGFLGIHTSEALSLACNLALIWVVFPLAAWLVQRGYRNMAAGIACFELLNGTGHIVQAIAFGTYNAGLLNSIFLCWPIGLWTLYVCFWKERQPKRNILLLLLSAVAYHVVLILCGVGMSKGIAEWLQAIIMIADGILIFVLWWLIARKSIKDSELTN